MPNLIKPAANAVTYSNERYAIVVSEWNKSVTTKLCEGAVKTLVEGGIDDDAIDVVWVPGAWEIPVIVQRLADTCRYVGIITLGTVIKGETAHDHWINQGVTDALMRIGTEHSLPVMFGVLMCDSMEQAINRAGGTVGNKGCECAEVALRMAALLKSLPTS